MDNKFKQKDEAEKSFGELESEQSFGTSNDAVEETAQDDIQQDDVAEAAQQEEQAGEQKDEALETVADQGDEMQEKAEADGAAGVDDGFGAVENEAQAEGGIAQDVADAEKADAGAGQAGAAGDILSTNSIAGGKEKKGRGRVFALAAILVLVLAGCVGAYFMMQPGEEKKADQKPTEQVEEETPYRLSGNGLSDFDLKLLKLKNNKTNIVYSPLSIKYALAMLKDGANGDTKKQIEDIIGDYKSKKYINSQNLSLANAMFIRDSYKTQVLDSYIDGLKNNYNASVIYDTFKDANVVNSWIKDKTLNLISKFMDDKDVASLNYLLVNALAIDQQWVYQLQCKDRARCLNGDTPAFTVHYPHEKVDKMNIYKLGLVNYSAMKFGDLKDRKAVEIGASYNKYDIVSALGEEKIRTTVTAEYEKWLKTDEGKWAISNYSENKKYDESLIDPEDVKANVDKYIKELKANYNKGDTSTDFYLYSDDEVKMFAKDLKEYDGTTLQYVGIMPKEKDLKTYIEELSAEKVTGLIGSLKEVKANSFKDNTVTLVHAYIPLFKYGSTFGLQEPLEEMGVKNVFSKDDADLSNMIKEEGAHIDVATHGATIDFGNDGIKAGAVTAMGGLGGGGIQFEYLWDVPTEKINLSFDKPFLYLLRDKNTGEVWFTGAVYEPTKCDIVDGTVNSCREVDDKF